MPRAAARRCSAAMCLPSIGAGWPGFAGASPLLSGSMTISRGAAAEPHHCAISVRPPCSRRCQRVARVSRCGQGAPGGSRRATRRWRRRRLSSSAEIEHVALRRLQAAERAAARRHGEGEIERQRRFPHPRLAGQEDDAFGDEAGQHELHRRKSFRLQAGRGHALRAPVPPMLSGRPLSPAASPAAIAACTISGP